MTFASVRFRFIYLLNKILNFFFKLCKARHIDNASIRIVARLFHNRFSESTPLVNYYPVVPVNNLKWNPIILLKFRMLFDTDKFFLSLYLNSVIDFLRVVILSYPFYFLF